MVVKIAPNDKGNPPGKLADAEIHFDSPAPHGECIKCLHYGSDCTCHPLAGLKLIGFAVWERRNGGGRNVTFPARQYSVNGERRSFALLRPVVDASAQERVKDLVIAAYEEYEASKASE